MKFSLFRRRKETTESLSMEPRISYLKSRSEYFKFHASKQPLFLPEHIVSKEILEVIEAADKTHEEKLGEIINTYNKITKVEHYDGSGWFDFQIMLKVYFHHYGYSVDFEKDTGVMYIEKV